MVKFRIELTRFRLSADRLAIETGRWHKPNKIPRNERKCCVCKTLEDEFHFLLECSIYKNLRQKYINKYFWKYPNILKFTELMVSENEITLQRLAIFVFKAFELRNQKLIF